MVNEVKCFVCDKILEIEIGSNPLVVHPVYDGLIFRALGNFGSTVFDPMPIGREEMLQVFICDKCIKMRPSCVTRIHNIQTKTTADSETFVAEKTQ